MKYNFLINNKSFDNNERLITGQQIRQIASLNNDVFILLKVDNRDEEISDDEVVDLARLGREQFRTEPKNPKYKFKVNNHSYEWTRFITGSQIRTIGSILDTEDVYLKVQGEDDIIQDNTKVDLLMLGIEQFYSKQTCITLIVDARPKEWYKRTITFEEIVKLSKGVYNDNNQVCYTVTYDRGPKQNPEGTMVKGDIVFVKNKMIFNVTETNKS